MFMKTRISFLIALVVSVFAAVSCMMSDVLGSYEDGFLTGGSEMGQQNPQDGDKYEEFSDNPFVDASETPVSTFSVDADGASYANMRRFIMQSNSLPSQNGVRIELFLDYFTFKILESEGADDVSICVELTSCPWAEGNKILRLGIKGKQLEEEQMKPSNFVFLIDVSGSMSSSDKLELLKSGLTQMVDYLRPSDRISIITYSGTVCKLLESTLCSDALTIKNAISSLVASGSTAGGAALKMAYEEALESYIEGGNNRIVMGTDGDFNVGVTDTDALVEMVESYASKGIYMTVCGFGRGNLNDAMMEKISNSGNGSYYYIDSEDELTKVFVNERSKFFAVANDCKVQITFNPQTVAKYRLIGYENRMLSESDFENDKKDASEIGAGQTVTALYELVPAETAVSDARVATFDFRYKKELGEDSIPLSMTVNLIESAEVSGETAFAEGIAAFGMILRKSPYKGTSDFELVKSLVEKGLDYDPYGYRSQFVKIVEKAQYLQ